LRATKGEMQWSLLLREGYVLRGHSAKEPRTKRVLINTLIKILQMTCSLENKDDLGGVKTSCSKLHADVQNYK